MSTNILEEWDTRHPVMEVVTAVGGQRCLEQMYRGFIPSDCKDGLLAEGFKNARAETIDVRPTFAESFRYRRCLVVSDCFHLGRREPDGRRPECTFPSPRVASLAWLASGT